MSIILTHYYVALSETEYSCKYSEHALGRRMKKIIRWSEINVCISESHFGCMFRMTRPGLKFLYEKIIANVGESKFKSEAYLDRMLPICK